MSYDPWFGYEQRFPGETARQELIALQTRFRDRSAHYIGFPNSRILSFAELGEFLK